MTYRLRPLGVFTAALLVLSACTSGSQPAALPATTSTETPVVPTSNPEVDSDPEPTSDDQPPSETGEGDDTRALLAARGLGTVTLHDTSEGGRHPTLSWDPFDGAASYWLVLRDADGLGYWAWTGTDASVRVGGGNSAEENQTAALHEQMTWSVAAFDEDGRLLAFSQPGTVTP